MATWPLENMRLSHAVHFIEARPCQTVDCHLYVVVNLPSILINHQSNTGGAVTTILDIAGGGCG